MLQQCSTLGFFVLAIYTILILFFRFKTADFESPADPVDKPFPVERPPPGQSKPTRARFSPVQDITRFTIRDFSPPEGRVDVVITWHCEDIHWISWISPEFASILTIVLLHKLDKEEENKKPTCSSTTIPRVPFNLTEVRLKNQGRDIHSPFVFIKNNYHTLADYTLFFQADQHWILRWSPGFPVTTFQNNAEAVNYFIPLALKRHARFIPIMPVPKEDGPPILFADRESNINTSSQDAIIDQAKRRVFTFDNGASDAYNAAREMYSIIFGGKACDAPKSSPLSGIAFIPGYQFVVSKHAILRTPLRAWAGLTDLTLGCGAINYAVERLSVQIFDSDRNIVDPDNWSEVSFCHTQFHPWDIYEASKFWRSKWNCEPLSDFLLPHTGLRKSL